MKSKFFFLFLIFTFLITAAPICKFQSKEVREAMQPVNLVYWRVFDDESDFADIIAAYRTIHPNVSITYRKLRYEEYEKELLDAMAENRGPDIFSIHNTWIKKYQTKIVPLPKTITLPYQYVAGTIKKEVVTEMRTTPSLSIRALKNDFVDQVAADVLLPYQEDPSKPVEERIFGLPLALDTMVLFYNRDMLNAAGIPLPPQTWTEFQEQVKRLTKIDKQGNILQSGAAIGTGKNVERASDILSLLMMQNGTQMTDEAGNATFDAMPPGVTLSVPPGQEALTFYTDFASPYKEVYTWNAEMPNSLEAFVTGKTAFFFGYSYHIPIIRAQAPKLNFAISRMPQIAGAAEVNFANYWVEVVSKKTEHLNEAWDFLQFAAKAENVKSYLAKTKKPTALRALISEQIEDIDLSTFASQVLTAKSWYHGKNPEAVENAFVEMIDNVVAGLTTPEEAIGIAAAKVNQTMR
jgi:ABC-type glycerol-3-phosphate transport system substrate-binding protein